MRTDRIVNRVCVLITLGLACEAPGAPGTMKLDGASKGETANTAQTSGTAETAETAGNADTGDTGRSTSSPSPMQLVNPNCDATTLIDDFEGSAPTLPEIDGRRGRWIVVSDETGWVEPNPAEGAFHYAQDVYAQGSFSARVSGVGTDWGAALSVALRDAACTSPEDRRLLADCTEPPRLEPYDVSRYRGVSFYARSSSGPTTVEFQVHMLDVIPIEDGGVCDLDEFACWPPNRTFIELDESWRLYEMDFDALMGASHHGGDSREWDPTRVATLTWLMQNTGETFDIAIDAVCFAV